MDVKVGDADAGLEVDITHLSNPSASQHLQITPSQQAYLSTLPPTEIIQARVMAYKAHNAGLVELTTQLKSRSVELEKKLRKVVTMCTGVEEEKLDLKIDGLLMAVDSERGEDVELGRVREFLRKVKGVEV